MDNERYKRIKESMPSSIVMAMEHIRRYLIDGKASVMVGAGFSKNAVKPDFVEMKDWNSLGKTFFRLLYSEPTLKSGIFEIQSDLYGYSE